MLNSQTGEQAQDCCNNDVETGRDETQSNGQSKQADQGVGVFFCMIYLIGTKIGAGIIGLPYAVFKIGYVTALIFQIFYIIIGIFSFYLLLKVREITGKSTISEIGYFCYGRSSIFFINALVSIAQLGFPVIFFIVYGDVAGGLIKKINSSNIDFIESRWFTHILLAICIVYFVLKKEIASLKYVGLACFVFIVAFIFLDFIEYVSTDPGSKPKTNLTESRPTLKFWASFPTILTSYAIHTSYYVGFNSLKDKTIKNGMKAGIISLLVMFCTYQASSLLSYGMYGGSIKSNMLVGLLSMEGPLPIILLILFLFISIMHIPLIFYIGKESILIIFDEITRRSYSKNQEALPAAETIPDVQIEEVPPIQNEIINQEEIIPENLDLNQEINENNQNDPEIKENIKKSTENNNEVVRADDIEVMNCERVKAEDTNHQLNPKEYLNMHSFFYYFITVFIFSLVVILSIVVGDVSIVFGVIGSVVSCFMVIAGPGSYYVTSKHSLSIMRNNFLDLISLRHDN